MATVNSTANKETLAAFAEENFGVKLDKDKMTQKEMYAEVKDLMEKNGHGSPQLQTATANDGSGDPVIVNGGGNETPSTDGGTGVEPPATPDNGGGNEPPKTNATTSTAQQTPIAYTIEIQKPADTQFEDWVCCVDGRNYQVRYNEPVKVPAAVVEVLRNAVINIPEYKNPSGKVEPARKKPRWVWAIHQKHFA